MSIPIPHMASSSQHRLPKASMTTTRRGRGKSNQRAPQQQNAQDANAGHHHTTARHHRTTPLIRLCCGFPMTFIGITTSAAISSFEATRASAKLFGLQLIQRSSTHSAHRADMLRKPRRRSAPCRLLENTVTLPSIDKIMNRFSPRSDRAIQEARSEKVSELSGQPSR